MYQHKTTPTQGENPVIDVPASAFDRMQRIYLDPKACFCPESVRHTLPQHGQLVFGRRKGRLKVSRETDNLLLHVEVSGQEHLIDIEGGQSATIFGLRIKCIAVYTDTDGQIARFTVDVKQHKPL